jgi:hypothetical protein
MVRIIFGLSHGYLSVVVVVVLQDGIIKSQCNSTSAMEAQKVETITVHPLRFSTLRPNDGN